MIVDVYGFQCILGNETETPCQGFMDVQAVPPLNGGAGKWFTAYPLQGGAIMVQEGAFTHRGNASVDELLTAMENANFFGKRAIIELMLG
jgi:hypothetical protein